MSQESEFKVCIQPLLQQQNKFNGTAEINKKETEINKLKEWISNLQQKIKTMEEREVSMIEQIQKLEAESDELKNQQIENNNNNDNLLGTNVNSDNLMSNQLETVEIENESLKQSISTGQLEIETMETEFIRMREETASLQEDYNNILNQKHTLSQELKDYKDKIKLSQQALLEEYYDKEIKWQQCKKQNENLQNEIDKLKQENQIICERNVKFEHSHTSLKNKLSQHEQKIDNLNEFENKYNDMANEFSKEVKRLSSIISDNNEQIADLREKLGLKHDDNIYRPITSGMKKTIRIEEMNALKQRTFRTDDLSAFTSTITHTGSPLSPRFASVVENNYEFYEDYVAEIDRLSKELSKMKSELDEERLSHEIEIKHIKRNYKNIDNHTGEQELIVNGGYEESTPLIASNRRKDQIHQIIQRAEIDDNNGCVCCSFRVW